MRHRIKTKDSMREESNLSRIEQLKHKSHLLHSDKSIKECAHRRCSLNTLFLEARSRRLPSQGHAANPRRNCGPSSKKVFTGAAHTYFYNNKLGSNSIVKTIPLVLSSLALLVVLGGLVNPASLNKVFALGNEEERTIASPNASISFSISNGGVVVGEDDTVSTEVTTGIVSYISNDIAITTKDINKFYVTVQAANGSTSELVGTEHKATIAPVGTNVATDSFGDNTWGYALSDNATSDSNLRYNSLPTYSASTTPQYTSSNDLADGNYNLKLTFAAKINANKPADHYTTKAMVSVVADAKSLPTLTDITYMQDMTPEICATTTTPAAFLEDGVTINSNVPKKQLIDRRDSKTYWIAKLADGNCWMTQNLDLDLNGVTLKPDDSDVSSDWISTTRPSTTSGYYTSDYYVAKYYDPGYSYYTNGTSKTDSNEALAKDTTGNEDAHWLIGNLYSWTAATAGTGTSSVISGDAPSSICPKGWQLPTSNNTDKDEKSFGDLTTTYDISNNSPGSNTMRSAPFYFIYGGDVNDSSFSGAGSDGYYWSSTTYDGDTAYLLALHGNAANPSVSNGARYRGFSVRCVVR